MKQVLESNVVLFAVTMTLLYLALASLFPPNVLITAINGASIGAAFLVSFIYARLFWSSVRRVESRVGFLAIGIGCLFVNFIGTRLLSGFYRAIGREDLLTNHPAVGFLAALGVVGIVLHAVAPGYPPQGFREKFGGRYRWFIVAFLVAGAIVALALTFSGLFK